MTTWTKEPPKEPGWYWRRCVIDSQGYRGEPKPYSTDGLGAGQLNEYYEWWPIPITPPSEEKT